MQNKPSERLSIIKTCDRLQELFKTSNVKYLSDVGYIVKFDKLDKVSMESYLILEKDLGLKVITYRIHGLDHSMTFIAEVA